MTLDLAKLFGVEEDELFHIKSDSLSSDYKDIKFYIKNNLLYICDSNDRKGFLSSLRLNDIDWNDFEIIKADDKIEFSLQDLNFLKLIYESSYFRYLIKTTTHNIRLYKDCNLSDVNYLGMVIKNESSSTLRPFINNIYCFWLSQYLNRSPNLILYAF